MAKIYVLVFGLFFIWSISAVFGQRQRQAAGRRPTQAPANRPIESDEEFDSENPCPPNGSGFFKDPDQCDRYFECRRGNVQIRLCEDGFVFDGTSPLYERCVYPFSVNCTGRTALQTPKPSQNCPRQNGLFRDEKDCSKFWQCTRGVSAELSCSGGLAFNPKTGICQWPANVAGCEALRHENQRPKTPAPDSVEDDEDDADTVTQAPPRRQQVPNRRNQQRNRPNVRPQVVTRPVQIVPPPAPQETPEEQNAPQLTRPSQSNFASNNQQRRPSLPQAAVSSLPSRPTQSDFVQDNNQRRPSLPQAPVSSLPNRPSQSDFVQDNNQRRPTLPQAPPSSLPNRPSQSDFVPDNNQRRPTLAQTRPSSLPSRPITQSDYAPYNNQRRPSLPQAAPAAPLPNAISDVDVYPDYQRRPSVEAALPQPSAPQQPVRIVPGRRQRPRQRTTTVPPTTTTTLAPKVADYYYDDE